MFQSLLSKLTLSAFTLSLVACSHPGQSLAAPLPRAPQMYQSLNQSTMSSESPTFFENRLRGFVYHWFSLFDSNAPHSEFLKRMAQNDLEFRFPEATLHNTSDFNTWYDGILKNIRVASHSVNQIQVQQLSKRQFIIHVNVTWRGVPYQGESIVFHAKQEWHVHIQGADYNDIRIQKYLVSAA